MLFEALSALLHEKDFEKVSVQDIAERASLNRATFYDHYPDKFALLEHMIGDQFEGLVARRGLQFDGCEGAIKNLAFVACDFLTELPCTPGKKSLLEMHVQMAMIVTMKAMIADGLKRHAAGDAHAQALAATAAAWAICGAANEWIRTPDHCSSETVAHAIELLVAPLFSAFPELP